jgi:hypothetical protein
MAAPIVPRRRALITRPAAMTFRLKPARPPAPVNAFVIAGTIQDRRKSKVVVRLRFIRQAVTIHRLMDCCLI